MAELFPVKHGVIVACDVKTMEDFERLVESTTNVDGIVGYKTGFILGLTNGLSNVVDAARDFTDKPIIYDHQKAGTDIPQMGPEFADLMKESGVDSAIIFPQSGPVTEEAFVKELVKRDVIPFVGGEMTHKGYLSMEGGYIRDDAPPEMYIRGAKEGATYFIVPGNRIEHIREYAKSLPQYVPPRFAFPGIGRQGGDIEAAFEATGGWPSYAIIGSAIYAPKEGTVEDAAKRFCEVALKFEK